MEWQFTAYAGVLIVAGLLLSACAILVWRRSTIPGGMTFTLLMLAAAELAFASGLEVAAVGIPAKVFWAKLEYVGNQSGPMLFLFFALKYTRSDRWLTPWLGALLWIMPTATVLLAATNEWHELIWTGFVLNPQNNAFLIYSHGPWYWLCAAYNYLAGASGWFILFWSTIRTPRLYRRQIGIVLAAMLIPGVGSLLYLTGATPIAGLDTAALTFALTALILTGGIFGFGLFRLLPVARHLLVENMGDSVLVLDMRDHIVDINRAARELLSFSSQQAVGQAMGTVLAAWPELLSLCREMREGQAEIRLARNASRYIEARISPVYDDHEHLTGRLIVLHDITERRQTQELLLKHVEELGIVNHINQAITSGLDFTQVLETLHRQCSLVATFDNFYVGLYDEKSALIQIPLNFSGAEHQPGTSRDLRQEPGRLGEVIEKRRTLYLPNVSDGTPMTHPDARKSASDGHSTVPLAGSGPIRSYLGIPLILRDHPIGALCFQSQEPQAFTEEQIRLLESIAVQAAIAVGNAQLYAEVQRLAIIDELTGLYNFRGLMALGAREVERARRFNHPLCILFLDIDGFRAFNNRYGHPTGNEVLQQVARCCMESMRSVDLVARYGGDEFVILLPETDLAAGREVSLRLSRAVAECAVHTRHGSLNVTISIGLAPLLPTMRDLTALIDRANQAEHAAKEQGTGQTVVVEE